MRCVIARFAFDLVPSEVEASLKKVTPEPAAGECVVIGGKTYPVKQVGEVITGQDRRDFSAGEVTRAMSRLGFTCRPVPGLAPAPVPTRLQTAAALLGAPSPA